MSPLIQGEPEFMPDIKKGPALMAQTELDLLEWWLPKKKEFNEQFSRHLKKNEIIPGEGSRERWIDPGCRSCGDTPD